MKKSDFKIETKNAVNDFVNQKEISKAALSKQIGISPATLTNLEEERWDVLTESMLLKIWNYVKPIDWSIVRTANFDAINKICNDAKNTGKMVSIIGYTGAGKTTALSEFYKRKPNVFMVTCKKSMKPRQFFEKLLKQLGVDFSGTIYDMIVKASELLISKRGPLLIIDEAGKFSPALLLYLHDLRDSTVGHAGIVLAGVDYFETNLLKAVNKQKEGMPELYSRITMWYRLKAINSGEIKAICEQNGLDDATIIQNLQRGEERVKDYRELYNAITNYKELEQEETE